MKTKHLSGHYSLEERMIEPFRSIRWISVSKRTIFVGITGLISFIALWWLVRNLAFQFWAQELTFLIKLIDEPWVVETGYWPNTTEPLALLPKLTAAILPPFQKTWWAFSIVSIAMWFVSGGWRPSLLPLKAITRFIIFLIWISLACFAISPMMFRHSVEEWSKIFFLGSYGSFLIYGIIWTLGVMWFPISTRVKITTTVLMILFEVVAVPLLLFICTVILKQSSLLLLPLFALLIAPLTQLGWFVSFYALALSAGSDPSKEVRLE